MEGQHAQLRDKEIARAESRSRGGRRVQGWKPRTHTIRIVLDDKQKWKGCGRFAMVAGQY